MSGGAASRSTRFAILLSVIALGLTAGALLAEAMLLVPFWQSLEPEGFLSWYGANASLLFEFFAPLEIATTVLVVVAALMSAIQRQRGWGYVVVAALLALGILLAFPAYFKEANAGFAAGTLPSDEVRSALRVWASWHWGRTLAALLAFIFAVLGIRGSASVA